MEVGAAWDMGIDDVLDAGRSRMFEESARCGREEVPAELKSDEFSA